MNWELLIFVGIVTAFCMAWLNWVSWLAYRWLVKRCISYGLRAKANRCPLCGLWHS